MLSIARTRAERMDRRVELGDAQVLELEHESIDTVIVSFGLCTIPDDRRAATEAHRDPMPRQGLLLLEHMRSPSRSIRIPMSARPAQRPLRCRPPRGRSP
jgi:ubiquinone/menaquinone biosynthesis C-methylase UbiE